jgi:hypothetical protein
LVSWYNGIDCDISNTPENYQKFTKEVSSLCTIARKLNRNLKPTDRSAVKDLIKGQNKCKAASVFSQVCQEVEHRLIYVAKKVINKMVPIEMQNTYPTLHDEVFIRKDVVKKSGLNVDQLAKKFEVACKYVTGYNVVWTVDK